MSQYHAQKTVYRDVDCLVGALNEQGYATVEVHERAVQLYDYCGRPTCYLDKSGDKANVIVRRHIVGGAANDLGFRKESDGTYTAIVSQFDECKHNADWMDALKQHYTERVDMKVAKRNGLQLMARKVTEVNGKKRIQLQFLDPRGN
jgi:hypothetical protein